MAKSDMTAFHYAARSALQKAIRRGDVGMVKQALLVTWEKEHNYLFWRLPIIIPEEIWPVAGRNTEELAAVQSLLREDREGDAFRRMEDWLCTLCTYEKNRDPNGLAMFFIDKWAAFQLGNPNVLPDLRRRQYRLMENAVKMRANGRGKEFLAALESKALERRPQALPFIEAARSRLFTNAMDGDKIMMMALAIQAVTEDPPPLKIVESVDSNTERARLSDWPWYVYDMHTYRGKSKMKRAMAELNWPDPQYYFERVWFALESGRVNKLDDDSWWWRRYLYCFYKQFKVNREIWDRVFVPLLCD